MNKYDKYLFVVNALKRRYRLQNGDLVISVGGIYSKYDKLEGLAAVKYLGCDPKKVTRI